MSGVFLLVSVFLASCVESVEALTIVLATGITRGWRSTFLAVGAGLLTLVLLIAIFGPAIATYLPIDTLRVVIGTLLLIFGLQWLRKAILRASGLKRLRDEAAIYENEIKALRQGDDKRSREIDWTAFVVVYKGVFLEGLEVAFIVITFGSSAKNIPLAMLGGVLAIIFVALLGVAIKGPLSRVPENVLKFSVGLMLIAFGTFWTGEGIGIDWPGSDLILIVLLIVYTAIAWGLVLMLRNQKAHTPLVPVLDATKH